MGQVCGHVWVSASGMRWVCLWPPHEELVKVNYGTAASFEGEGHHFVRDVEPPSEGSATAQADDTVRP